MGIHVETSIEVEVPVHVAYDRWMRCTDEPRAQDVQQAGETLTHWGAEIDGVRREWDALMARADGQEITWTATTGSTRPQRRASPRSARSARAFASRWMTDPTAVRAPSTTPTPPHRS